MPSKFCRVIAAAVLTILGLTSAARAQHGSMSMSVLGGSDSFRPDLTQRDLGVIVRVLGLRGESLRSLQDLYDGYAGTLASEGRAVREYVAGVIEKAETLQNVDLLAPARQRVKEWEARSEQIKKTFLEDLKSLLTQDEEARWPIVERELRRLRYVGRGILSGENVDLVKLTEDVVGESGATGALADLLNRYSDELDGLLVARTRALEENREEYAKALKGDPEKARTCWGEINDARLGVQALNDRYASMIAAMVGPEQKQKFERAWLERCYPMVCRPSRLDEYIKEALLLSTLTAEQRSQLKAIAGAYEERVWAHRAVAAKAWRQFESDYRRQQLADAIAGNKEDRHQQYNGAWLPETHPINTTRKDRLEIDQSFRRQVDGVLTPEQRDALPARLTPYAKFENWQPWDI